MIYCVIPHELEGELFARMTDRYRDNDGVEVILERRTGERDRRRGGAGATDERRVLRDRRRARAPGTFPRIDVPDL